MTLNDPTAVPTPLERPAYRYYVLGLLTVVYTFNFIDRQVLAILAPYIQAEMKFTDSQLGLLGGPAFAVVYSTLALPIAWLADRISRTSIIATSLAIWSRLYRPVRVGDRLHLSVRRTDGRRGR